MRNHSMVPRDAKRSIVLVSNFPYDLRTRSQRRGHDSSAGIFGMVAKRVERPHRGT